MNEKKYAHLAIDDLELAKKFKKKAVNKDSTVNTELKKILKKELEDGDLIESTE